MWSDRYRGKDLKEKRIVINLHGDEIMMNRAFCFLLIILFCLITSNDSFAKEKGDLENKKNWWIETTVVRDNGVILNRSTTDNYSLYGNYDECMAVLKASKMHGAVGGDAQVVVVLKCVFQKQVGKYKK